MSSTIEVYKGVWKDHANGVWTLTLSERSGGILSAAVIIFAGFAAAQAWNIVKFVLHQALSSQKPSDGYRHNLRAVLRNSNSHTEALWLFVRLSGGWRKKLGLATALLRGSLLITLALVFVIASAVIRLYIPLMWTANGDQVLIKNGHCGYVSISPGNITAWSVYWADRMESATTYVRQCYGETQSSGVCARQPSSRLNWTSSDAACPFTDTDLCITDNSVPLMMDTGYINTNRHLGMNAKDEDAIDYRKIVTCSPMRSNFVDITYSNSTSLNESILHYYYGSRPVANASDTLAYYENSLRYVNGYTLTTLGYDPAGTSELWLPNTTITDRTDVGASIFFLSPNWMPYLSPVSDPWFATDPGPSRWIDALDVPIYLQARPVSVLGCIEQHQLCRASASASSADRQCTAPLSSRAIPAAALALGMSARQSATAMRLVSAAVVQQPDFSFIARMMPGDRLLAAKTLVTTTQYGALPADQWRAEVARWFGMSLALIQEGVVEYVVGPGPGSVGAPFVVEQADGAALDDCASQRIRVGAGYTSFHLPALIVVVVVGCAVAVVGMFVDVVVGALQAWWRVGEYRRLQWVMDGAFQQQRLMYEAAGVGGWVDASSYVPVTEEKSFPLIDGTDRGHPRLRRRSVEGRGDEKDGAVVDERESA
ncbi:hypothetical protein B0J12DRAFT_414152 [Macrophomina phaseolina]|uniref:Cytochrome P450 n=1 Tax=Macrophomina phaseolina TaxID=35725 RepID=A0ABQ8GJJ1_9PEZI|nr:hypothetical protein B0J12DRAFT_414152 [Macrophomina phaseolina]